MAIIYGIPGAVTDLLRQVNGMGAKFQSVQEIQEFQKTYQSKIDHIQLDAAQQLDVDIQHQKERVEADTINYDEMLEQRKVVLTAEKESLPGKIESVAQQIRGLKGLYYRGKRYVYQRRLKSLEHSFIREAEKPIKKFKRQIEKTMDNITYQELHKTSIIAQRSQQAIQPLQRIYNIIESNRVLLAGAVGETKAMNQLRQLSNEYHIINDLQLTFPKAVYYRKENDHIQSIQVDHVIICPAGVFIIETKNWSQQFANNESYFSPVKQIARSNFALYLYFKDQVRLSFWRKKNVPIKNILLWISYMPRERPQYIKMCSLTNILGYIHYFQPVLSEKEVKKILSKLPKSKQVYS